MLVKNFQRRTPKPESGQEVELGLGSTVYTVLKVHLRVLKNLREHGGKDFHSKQIINNSKLSYPHKMLINTLDNLHINTP